MVPHRAQISTLFQPASLNYCHWQATPWEGGALWRVGWTWKERVEETRIWVRWEPWRVADVLADAAYLQVCQSLGPLVWWAYEWGNFTNCFVRCEVVNVNHTPTVLHSCCICHFIINILLDCNVWFTEIITLYLKQQGIVVMLQIFFCENVLTPFTPQSQTLFSEERTIWLVLKGLFEG